MDELIITINKLQDVLSGVGISTTELIDLPQIAVVGSQSSGKSSVLEAFVGKDFLPRGSGLVTRRPLVLQLYSLPPGSQEYGEFLHAPGVKWTSFDEINKEIVRDTDRVTGKNAGISNHPINLRVYSPDVVNLTLIDLPGLTKVPVGDQPTDIEQQIRSMINQYISRPNCIVLAVTAANTDIANSDALQLAKAVDPTGERTIGVITKLDLMDKGTDAKDVLLGKVIPLKRGFIGIVNRSQADINARKSVQAARESERQFFMSHSTYSSMMHALGTPLLAKTLNRMLTEHIRSTIPDIRRKVSDMITEYEGQMAQYGEFAGSSAEKGALLLQALTSFAEDYKDAIDGTMVDIPINELFGGARITYIFNEIFTHTLDKLDALAGLSDYDIRTAIRNVAGATTGVFVPEESFELIVKRQIARLEAPAQECVSLVFDEMRRIMNQIEPPELERFPSLRTRVLETAGSLIRENLPPTQDVVNDLISMELGYINTDHPDFIGATGAMAHMVHELVDSMQQEENKKRGAVSPNRDSRPPPSTDSNNWKFWKGTKSRGGTMSRADAWKLEGRRNPDTPEDEDDIQERSLPSVPQTLRVMDDPTKRELVETEIIRALLRSYFDISRRNVEDAVPKAIMCFLVTKTKELMEQRLLTSLYKEDMFDDLLEEAGDVAGQRQQCYNSLQLLRKAQGVLKEVQV